MTPALLRILLVGAAAAIVPACHQEDPPSTTVIVYLRAQPTTLTMPGGEAVTVWAYARDSSFGRGDGPLTVPGPVITLFPITRKLVVRLDNNLPEPTSVVINGLNTTLTPVRNPDGRLRSFTHETPPGNTQAVEYVFDDPPPGTYLYASGTHPAVQVQMGLYGACIRDSGQHEAYPGIRYFSEATILYSEIDPVLHQAVAAGDYGPGKSVTSTINYRPKYFLVNGMPHYAGRAPVALAPTASNPCLVRFLNAGLRYHSPAIHGMTMSEIAEDGHVCPEALSLNSILLPPGKTKDVLVVPPSTGTYAVYDRMLGLASGTDFPSGMVLQLTVGSPVAAAKTRPAPRPDSPVSETVLSAIRAVPRPREDRAARKERSDFEKEMGIDILGIRSTAAGYMLDMRYRIVDPEKAESFISRKAGSFLIDEKTGARLAVPAPAKIGPLRSKGDPDDPHRVHYMLFANPGKAVRSGQQVTLQTGSRKAEHLAVQ
jgi:FtsP/CotA-like multicopper oxidase with cupredoxin domain